MASAKKMEPAQPSVQLTLTAEEASVLHALTQLIGGDARTTYRHMTDEIGRALRVAGVSGDGYAYFSGSGSLTGKPRSC